MEKNITSLRCYLCKNQIWDVPFIDPHDRTFCCKSHGKRFFVSKVGPKRAKAIKLKNPPEILDHDDISNFSDLYNSLYNFRTNPTSFDLQCSSLASRSGTSSLRKENYQSNRLKKPLNFLFYPITATMKRRNPKLTSSFDENYFLDMKITRKNRHDFSLFGNLL